MHCFDVRIRQVFSRIKGLHSKKFGNTALGPFMFQLLQTPVVLADTFRSYYAQLTHESSFRIPEACYTKGSRTVAVHIMLLSDFLLHSVSDRQLSNKKHAMDIIIIRMVAEIITCST